MVTKKVYGNGSVHRREGMTLRDYFAAKAMQTLCGVPTTKWPKSALSNNGSISAMAYEIADAMLKMRKPK
jgi:hypothetical protein